MSRKSVFMTKRRIELQVFVAVAAIGLMAAVVWVGNARGAYAARVTWTKVNLRHARRSVELFAQKQGRFPASVQELDEYGQKDPNAIDWHYPVGEAITSHDPAERSEHGTLNGAGGLYYDPQTGTLKVNLTEPLRAYWPLYFGKERNEIPADW